MRYDKLLNNTRFKSLVKRQRSIVSKFQRTKYISSLTREINTYLYLDSIKPQSLFVKKFR